jgi:hypothetical protein
VHAQFLLLAATPARRRVALPASEYVDEAVAVLNSSHRALPACRGQISGNPLAGKYSQRPVRDGTRVPKVGDFPSSSWRPARKDLRLGEMGQC